MALVCATNFSAVSWEALRATAALATRRGEREIWLVHVLETGSKGLGEQERAHQVPAVEKKLETDADVIRASCVAEVRCIALVDDDASHALLEFSETREASLLVVSSKGHRDSRSLGWEGLPNDWRAPPVFQSSSSATHSPSRPGHGCRGLYECS